MIGIMSFRNVTAQYDYVDTVELAGVNEFPVRAFGAEYRWQRTAGSASALLLA
jgi:hypothetical protein